MDNTEKLMTQLYEKASAEQKNFTDEFKNSTPENVIQNAYELVIREDILMTFEDNNYLDEKEIKALLKVPDVLSTCYNHWLENDYSHMDMLRDTVSDFAKGYAKSIDNKKQHKKKMITNADRRGFMRKYIYVFLINDKHSICTPKCSLLVAFAPNTPPVDR